MLQIGKNMHCTLPVILRLLIVIDYFLNCNKDSVELLVSTYGHHISSNSFDCLILCSATINIYNKV